MTSTDTRTRTRLGASYWKLFSASAISNTGDGVGFIAYPWLASAVTRNPLLIVSSVWRTGFRGWSSACRPA